MLNAPPLVLRSGKSSDEIVAELASALEADLPKAMSRDEAAQGLFDRTATGQLNSLSVVLGQEMDRSGGSLGYNYFKAQGGSSRELGRPELIR